MHDLSLHKRSIPIANYPFEHKLPTKLDEYYTWWNVEDYVGNFNFQIIQKKSHWASFYWIWCTHRFLIKVYHTPYPVPVEISLLIHSLWPVLLQKWLFMILVSWLPPLMKKFISPLHLNINMIGWLDLIYSRNKVTYYFM